MVVSGRRTLALRLGYGVGRMTVGDRCSRAGAGIVFALAVFCGADSTAIAGDGSFPDALASTAPAGDAARAVAVGDFNNDGNQDLVAANFSDDNLTVRLGDGAGGFATESAGSPFGTANSPTAVAVADFNSDGNEDLAAANTNADSVTIRLGNGAGGFATQPVGSPFTTSDLPRSIAVGYFNGDGVADLATANGSFGDITVRLGNGVGGFPTEVSGSPFAAGPFAEAIAAGDFNSDGITDLAVANQGAADNLTVRFGNGAGGFPTQPAGSPFPAGDQPSSIAVGDFNNDGNGDLAAANAGSDNLTVRLGDGAGGFATEAPGSPSGAGDEPVEIAVGDFNSDGNQDLALANERSDNLTVRLGDGAGGFTNQGAGSPLGSGDRPLAIAVGDFDRDGSQDLVAANSDDSNLTIRRGGGSPADAGNLLVNGGGEAPAGETAPNVYTAVAPIPGWTTTGAFTNHRYGIGAADYPSRLVAAPIGGQEAYFTIGLTTTTASASQTVDVSSSALSIDAGLARATLRGYLGGYRIADDTMQATARFNDAAGAGLGAPIQLGPVTTAERKNLTALLRREGSTLVPPGTRSITVTLLGTHGASIYGDAAYADRMGLFLDAPPDVHAPQTTITKAPKNKLSKRKAKYKFTSTEAGSSFECRLDSKRFKRCSSPRKLKRLELGKHKFAVRATDPSGNTDRSPAKDRFKRKRR